MAVSAGPDIVENGLVMCLDAGNRRSYSGTGTGWANLIGLNKNAILVNGPTFSNQNIGSISFDGSDDYVNTELLNTDLPSINCSLEIWFNSGTIINNKFTTLGGQRSSADNKTPLGLWIEARNSWPGNYSSNYGVLGITRGTVITADLAIKSPPGSIVNNTWYQVCLVSSTLDTKLYINGVLISTVISSGSQDNSTVGSFGVGCFGISENLLQYPSNLSNQFISIMNVYNRALSSQEISQNFNALRGRFNI